jgi:hypothetical protein
MVARSTLTSALRCLNLTKLTIVTFIGIAFTITVIALNESLTWLHSAKENKNAKAAPNDGTMSPAIKAIRFVITQRGIEPANITIPAGRYWVAVDNTRDLNGIDIKIDRVNGPRIKDATTMRGERKFRDFLDFTPGQYVLSEKRESRINSMITVTNAE